MKKLSTNIFIKRAQQMHGDKYDYTKTVYKSLTAPIIITCPIHGDFQIRADSHIHPQRPAGCTLCAKDKQRLPFEQIISKLHTIHNNKYDYSQVQYVNIKTPVQIICPIHGIFWQTLESHLHGGRGCPKCAGNVTRTKSQFLKLANDVHNNKYEYGNKTSYAVHSTIDVKCPQHGWFEQKIFTHLAGGGCPQCAIEQNSIKSRHTTQQFIEKARCVHGDLYDYSQVQYVNIKTPVQIICAKHGPFFQQPNHHLSSQSGCPKCSNIQSKGEQNLVKFLREQLKITNIVERSRKIIEPLELDIFLPDFQLAIEYNGIYWHSDLHTRISPSYHSNKTRLCEQKNIHLIHIFEDQWLNKPHIIKSRLQNIVGQSKRIYARRCVVKEITTKSIVQKFLQENHLFGSVNSKKSLGLFYEKRLVSLMTFGALRKIMNQSGSKHDYELLRFCTKKNFVVVGGAQRLFKHFVKKYQPQFVRSYADHCWSTNLKNNVYKQLGFQYSHLSQPNYYYCKNQQRFHRANFQKHKLVKRGFDKNKTEKIIMEERGYARIYDCGHLCYEWKN